MFCMLKIEKCILPMFQIIKESIRLIIPNGQGWHYIAVKILPAFLRGITSKHHGELKYYILINTKSLIMHHYLFVKILNV